MTKEFLDADGQPPWAIGAERRQTRDVSEMLGIVKGILADGKISVEEAQLLSRWGASHRDALREWPCDVVYGRLLKIFGDGRVDPDELEDLRELLSKVVGGEAGLISGQPASSQLPLDEPAPQIEFAERLFVLTGKFAFGPRKKCEEVVSSFGGRCHPGVLMATNYLVVGTFASRDWRETTHGTKILKALAYKERGKPIAIISEEHWARQLPR